MMNAPLAERLEKRIEIDLNGGCWLWSRGLNASGYGVLGWKRRQVLAHRASYETHKGPIPSGALVCHRCDIRACINPAHLFIGSHSDNTRDMYAKSRGHDRRGERHPLARLTADAVLEIRERYRAGQSQRRIAADYGVCQTTIAGITTGGRWSHVQ